MAKFLIIFLIAFASLTFGQNKINVDNYYSYFKGYDFYEKNNLKRLGTGRLDEFEIAKVLREEMKLAGFEWLSNFQIIHLDNQKYITSICYSRKSNFGFVLETMFGAEPEKHNREIKSLRKKWEGYDYGETILDLNGKVEYLKINELPENLYLIKQDIYWFQTTENEKIQKSLVTREIAIEILREDVKNILKSVKVN
jgi:hypothetical protein